MALPQIHLGRVSLPTTAAQSARLITVTLPDGVVTPAEFAAAVAALPDLSGPDIVLLTGRAPIWGYGMLLHLAHATPAVGCYDPRLGGFVIVQSHHADWAVGDLLTLPHAEEL